MEFLAENPAVASAVAAAILVFIVDLLGNSIAFGSKVINAIVTAILFGGVIYGLDYADLIEINKIIDLSSLANGTA